MSDDDFYGYEVTVYVNGHPNQEKETVDVQGVPGFAAAVVMALQVASMRRPGEKVFGVAVQGYYQVAMEARTTPPTNPEEE